MGRKKIFGITLYRKIQKNGSAPCPERGCDGEIKYVRTRYENPEAEFILWTLIFIDAQKIAGIIGRS